MTLITRGFRVSVVSDVRERVRDIGSPLRFMLRRSSLVECVSVIHGTCLQSVDFFFIRHYVQPCLSKNPKYTFYTIKSSLTFDINAIISTLSKCFYPHLAITQKEAPPPSSFRVLFISQGLFLAVYLCLLWYNVCIDILLLLTHGFFAKNFNLYCFLTGNLL